MFIIWILNPYRYIFKKKICTYIYRHIIVLSCFMVIVNLLAFHFGTTRNVNFRAWASVPLRASWSSRRQEMEHIHKPSKETKEKKHHVLIGTWAYIPHLWYRSDLFWYTLQLEKTNWVGKMVLMHSRWDASILASLSVTVSMSWTRNKASLDHASSQDVVQFKTAQKCFFFFF